MSNDYLKKRFEMKLAGKTPEPVKRAEAQAKKEFFETAIKKRTKTCENCGDSLTGTMGISKAAIIAHIIQKAYFPSVALHPMNIMYLCINCHAAYDTGSEKDIQAMPVFPIAVERLKHFKHLIQETRSLPAAFLNFGDAKPLDVPKGNPKRKAT